MTLWQKRLRFLILAAGIACAVAVALAVKKREIPPPAPQLNRTDPNASVESIGTIVVQAKGERPEFRIDGGRNLTYADGRIRFLEGVKVQASKKDGRSFVLTGREADVSSDQSNVVVRGSVKLESNDGFVATANDATYSKAEGMIRTEGPATFTHKNTSGHGTGMTYDEPRDVVWILHDAVVDMSNEGSEREPVRVQSGAAGMARRDKYLKFTGGVHVESPSRRIETDEATAFLSDDSKRIQMIELRGNSHVESAQGGSGALRNMHARDMNIAYGPDGRTMQRATLAGTSMVAIAGEAPGQERRLNAEFIDIGLGSNGRTVSDLTSRDRVEFTMPGNKTSASRVIRAGSFEAAGDKDGGLDHAKFAEGIEYREMPAGTDKARTIKAHDLYVRFKAGLVTLEEARFVGGITLEDGGTKASGAEARYILAGSRLILVGSPGGPPHVATPEGSIDAERFELGMDGRTIKALNKVKSILLPVEEAKAAGGRDAKRPHIMKADQAINGMADRLETDEKNGRALYKGNARVWQADTSIQADSITMDDRTGDLVAGGNVRSVMMLEQTNPDLPRKARPGAATPPEERERTEKPSDEQAEPEKKTTKTTTIAAARELQYEDKTRRTTYKNDAHVNGAQGDLKADRIQLYLSDDGEQLERLEAYGHVALRDEARAAISQRLSYFVKDERYILTGDVRVSEECRETTGRTLTFFKSTDTISVDGNSETRTQTRSSNTPLSPQPQAAAAAATTGTAKCTSAKPR